MKQEPDQMSRIYIIDDSESIGILLMEELSDFGYKTQNFVSGEAGLQAILTDPPDLLLLDAVLPDIHGFDICKRLRESPKTKMFKSRVPAEKTAFPMLVEAIVTFTQFTSMLPVQIPSPIQPV